jgi:fibronectin-binding autotransporter adhesin
MSVPACSRQIALACLLGVAALLVGRLARAADVIKADNADALNVTTSWTGGAVPTAADVGVWDNTVTGANSVALGGNLSWQGIRIADPGGAVTITSGSTLTLGTAGIDMSAATQDLSIASGVTLGADQSWTVDDGLTLAVSGAIGETGGARGLTKAGVGTLTLTGGNSYTGTTTVSAGTLSLGSGATSGSLSDASDISIASGAEFHWNRSSSDITFANSISGSGTFAKTGGELGLTGSNNLSGTLELRGGKLGAEGANSLGGNPALIVSAGTLSLGGGYSGATATGHCQ